MPAWRQSLLLISLAVALIVAGQRGVGHAHAMPGVTVGAGQHCPGHKDDAPPVERRHGADCGLCQLCGAVDAVASPPQPMRLSTLTRTCDVWIKLSWPHPRAGAQAHRARASPLFG
jgi:hypothetical protein